MTGETVIREITDADGKQRIARSILEALPEWFEIEQAREEFIAESASQIFLAAEQEGSAVGFLCLKRTGNVTAEIAVMGVLKTHHRRGIGRALAEGAKDAARRAGFSFLQVKTVQMGVWEEYDRTNRFYISCGFQEFEVIPAVWGAENPCQIYVLAL